MEIDKRSQLNDGTHPSLLQVCFEGELRTWNRSSGGPLKGLRCSIPMPP